MPTWTIRQAQPEDAEEFARWVSKNPQIDPDDVLRTIKGNNPSCVTFVACEDGKPVAFAPIYMQAALAHLAFSPESRASEKVEAVSQLLDFTVAFAFQFGIREIVTLTKPEYMMARVAEKLGFEADTRLQYKFDINKNILEKEQVV